MGKKILYVDDNSATGQTKLKDIDCQLVVKDPTDFKEANAISKALRGIKIVLMDYDFKDSNFDFSVPVDGINLLDRFRAVIRHEQDTGNQAPMLTIYTGMLNELIKDFECPSAPHVVARQANVDWVFKKGAVQTDFEITQSRLGAMLSGFEFDFDQCKNNTEDQLFGFLELPKNLLWTELAKADVRKIRPPTQAINGKSSHATLMKWLLQVALPNYGCFVDLPWIAMRFHFQLNELTDALRNKPSSKFAEQLNERKYTGALGNFYSENRYWAAGIDHLIWEYTLGFSPLQADVREGLIKAIGKKIPALNVQHPVLLLDPVTFQQTGRAVDMEDAVQVQPDFWPPGVDFPWVQLSDVTKDRKLLDIVIDDDKDRIPED